jgi:triacylglycerol lipase
MQKPPPEYDARFVFHPEEDKAYVRFEGASGHPFIADPPAGVPRINAWWLAEAALTCYGAQADALPIYASAGLESRFVSKNATDGYVAWNDTAVIVAFRGTEPDQLEDSFTDANIVLAPWRAGHVHCGFKLALEQVWPQLSSLLDTLQPGRQVWFCGHSLGAALATLAADLYPHTRGVCTFGCPRVGDRTFTAAFARTFGDRSLRYVNNHDLVTHVPLPPLYKHVEARRWIAPGGAVSNTEPALPHFFSMLIGQPAQLANLARGLESRRQPFAPQFILDHMPKAYAIWTWNDYDQA